jgi:hypothetical protein
VGSIIELLYEEDICYIDLKKILDFGCGCGPVFAGWETSFQRAQLAGSGH